MRLLKRVFPPATFLKSFVIWKLECRLLIKKHGSFKKIPKEQKKLILGKLRQPEIEKALLGVTNNKCAYCESLLAAEARTWDIDHWVPKGLYPNVAFSWKNLVPACEKCNSEKRDHNTLIEPILHPYRDNPLEFVSYLGVFPKPMRGTLKEIEAERTIRILKLDRSSLAKKRHVLLESLLKTRDGIEKGLKTYKKVRVSERGKVLSELEECWIDLQRMCSADREFSHFIQTHINHDSTFQELNALIESVRDPDRTKISTNKPRPKPEK